MARPTKSGVVGDFRKSQILEAARQCFIRHGLAATTVDHIAKTARVAKGTVYLYYPSKDAILRAALAEGIAALHTRTVPVITAPAAVEARLRRFLAAMIGFFAENRGFIELCQSELTAEMRQKARQKWGQIYAAQTRAWQAALEEAESAGAIAGVDARRAAVAIVSLAHGLAIQHLRGWTEGPLEDDIAQASALLWKGLSVR